MNTQYNTTTQQENRELTARYEVQDLKSRARQAMGIGYLSAVLAIGGFTGTLVEKAYDIVPQQETIEMLTTVRDKLSPVFTLVEAAGIGTSMALGYKAATLEEKLEEQA